MASNATFYPTYETCFSVSELCPVEATTLGYLPNKGINIFVTVMFGVALVALVGVLALGRIPGVGRVPRTWAYSCFLAAGAALELAGYAGRVPLHDNPWNKDAFQVQIVAIILAPTLICIGVYLTLQHICLALCPQLSRVRPTLYPWLFVPLDVSCLLVQAIGGALAASAGYTNYNLLQAGNRAIIAGIVLQVVVLALFGLASLDYAWRVSRWINGKSSPAGLGAPSAEVLALWRDRKFRTYALAVSVAFGCIMVRCIYRVAEMAGGWGNEVMQDEPSFIVLESIMVLVAVLILAFFQPGYLFPRMAMGRKARRALAAQEAGSSGESAQAAPETTEKTAV